MRRVLTCLVLATFLAVTTGATSMLHLHHDDHSCEPQDCKTCQFIKAATASVVAAAVLVFLLRDEASGTRIVGRLIPIRRRRFNLPAGPRAPPRH